MDKSELEARTAADLKIMNLPPLEDGTGGLPTRCRKFFLVEDDRILSDATVVAAIEPTLTILPPEPRTEKRGPLPARMHLASANLALSLRDESDRVATIQIRIVDGGPFDADLVVQEMTVIIEAASWLRAAAHELGRELHMAKALEAGRQTNGYTPPDEATLDPEPGSSPSDH